MNSTNDERERHPLNAAGDFYVENGPCLCCDAPYSEAPGLIDYDEDYHCYFKRQPQTPEELQQAVSAVCVSCVAAVRYAGNDSDVLGAIVDKKCGESCDAILQPPEVAASKPLPEAASWLATIKKRLGL